ncbi:MAG TPA: hypothetical protein VJ454_16975, partial [Steroidobacteraceae bacterium]|nr:hypothetical protein [Steroidobacteraceae bacterium]
LYQFPNRVPDRDLLFGELEVHQREIKPNSKSSLRVARVAGVPPATLSAQLGLHTLRGANILQIQTAGKRAAARRRAPPRDERKPAGFLS